MVAGINGKKFGELWIGCEKIFYMNLPKQKHRKYKEIGIIRRE